MARSSNVTGLLAGSALVPLTLDGLSFAAFTLALRAFRINPDLHTFLSHEFDLLDRVEMWDNSVSIGSVLA